MKEEFEQTLVEKYPKILEEHGGDPRQTCMAWGFECGNGWFKIIEEVCEKLTDIEGFKFAQVKEKFGMLTIYYNGPHNEKDEEYVRSTINEAGKRSSDGGWLSTECKICKTIKDVRKKL